MNDEAKLDLSWVQRGGREPEPCLRFEIFDKTRAASLSYEAVLSVCVTPTCPCCAVLFYCRPRLSDSAAAPPGLARQFWLDVAARSLQRSPELNSDPEALRLAKVVRTRLTDAAWGQLYQWFRAAKLEVIRNAKVAEIETTNLPDADGGLMVGFVDVFPWGLALDFSFENELWAADDQYCVRSECHCTETVLSFLRLERTTGRRIFAFRGFPAHRYNYRSHAASAVAPRPTGVPDSEQLLAALKTAQPVLDEQLEFRHRLMQSLYARRSVAVEKL